MIDSTEFWEEEKADQGPQRVRDWKAYSEKVIDHIINYANKQYDNPAGNDQVSSWTSEQCVDAIRKYCARFGKNVRGPKEQLRDLLKIAHYSQLAFDKLEKEGS